MSSGTVTLANLKLQESDNMAFVDFSSATALKLYDGHRLVMRDSSGKRKMGCVHYNASDTPFVNLTYAAAGSSGITVADNDNIDFRTSNFTLRWKGSLPDWTPADDTYLLIKTSAGNYGIQFVLNTTGALTLYLFRNDAGTGFTSTVTNTLTDGTTHEISAVVTRETASAAGSVVFYIDGVALGTPKSITAAATVTLSNTGTLYISCTSGARYASTTSSVTLFNRALTSAEVLSLYQSGVATADQCGSQTAKYSCTTDFSGWATSVATNTGGCLTFITNASTWQRAYADTLAASTYNGKNLMLEYEVTANTAVGITAFRLLADDINKINHTNIALDTTVGVHRYYFQGNSAGVCQTVMFYLDGVITAGSMVIVSDRITDVPAAVPQ